MTILVSFLGVSFQVFFISKYYFTTLMQGTGIRKNVEVYKQKPLGLKRVMHLISYLTKDIMADGLLDKVFSFLATGGPTAPIKPRLPSSSTRTPPRVTRTENKTDDKLFEFLNSNVPSSKERKPIKPKVFVESSSEVAAKPIDTVDLENDDATDGQLAEGELKCLKILLLFLHIFWTYPLIKPQ